MCADGNMEAGSFCKSRLGKGRKERMKSKIESLRKEKDDFQRKSRDTYTLPVRS